MQTTLKFTKSIIDKIFFAIGLFFGSQIPNFIIQYRQRIGGRLDEVTENLKQFQLIAEKFHYGSIENLIQKHLLSNDPTFSQEGILISKLVERKNYLLESYNLLNTNLINQIKYLVLNFDPEIASATWSIYKPGLSLTVEAVICAFIAGFLFSFVFYFFAFSSIKLINKLRTKRNQ